MSEVFYEVHMTCVLHTARISNVERVMFVENYFYLQTFDIADTSSMQDACHINFVIDLAHRGVSVAHWLEHRSAASPKVRDSIPHRNSEFFLCPTHVTRRKHLSLFSLPSSKLTMSLIST